MKKRILIIGSAILIVAFILIIIICAKEPPLPAYDAALDDAPATPDFSWGTSYTDNGAGISLIIPNDFTYVVKSGMNTWVHAGSSAYFQINAREYQPSILGVTEESLINEVTTYGGAFEGFSRISDTSYMCKYSINGSVYIDRFDFDRERIVTTTFSCPDEYDDRMSHIGVRTLETVEFYTQYQFPTDVAMYYNELGNFQYGIPKNWQATIDDGILYASDTTYGIEMMLYVEPSNDTFADYTQIDYVNETSQAYARYVLSSFQSSDTTVEAIGQYYFNGSQRVLMQFMMRTGEYMYHLYFTCPTDTFQSAEPTIANLINLFSVY